MFRLPLALLLAARAHPASPLADRPRLVAQAEPAPDPEPPPPPPEPAQAPETPPAAAGDPAPEGVGPQDFALTISAGGVKRVGKTSELVGPDYGFEVATTVAFTYARLANVELSLGVGFAYQRFRKTVQVVTPLDSFEDERTTSFYAFEAHQGVALPLGFARPWADVGGGFALAYFASREPALAPGEKRGTYPALSVDAGVDFPVGHNDARFGVAAGWAMVFGAPDFTSSTGRTVPLFGARRTRRRSDHRGSELGLRTREEIGPSPR